MANKRISQLDALTGSASANDDNLVIFDTSANATKRILRSQLAIGLAGDLPYTPSGTISATTIPTAIAELDTEKSPIASPTFTGTVTLPDVSVTDAKNIALGTTTGTKIGTTASQKLGFYGATPVIRQTELTDELTTITHTAPGTPDYAIQDLTQTTPYGFATKDEGNTVLSVIANLQARVNELENKLVAYGLLPDAD